MAIPKLVHLWKMKVKGELGERAGAGYLQLQFPRYNREHEAKILDE